MERERQPQLEWRLPVWLNKMAPFLQLALSPLHSGLTCLVQTEQVCSPWAFKCSQRGLINSSWRGRGGQAGEDTLGEYTATLPTSTRLQASLTCYLASLSLKSNILL